MVLLTVLFATFELRVLAWVVITWLVLVLTVLTHGAPLPAIVFGVWRRLRRRWARRAVAL